MIGSFHRTFTQPRLFRRQFVTVVQQYEKAVTFTLGKFSSIKEPGLRLRIPFFQHMETVDMRTHVKRLNAFSLLQVKVVDPKKAVCHVHGVNDAIKEFTQFSIPEERFNRDALKKIQNRVEDWGVDVECIHINQGSEPKPSPETFSNHPIGIRIREEIEAFGRRL